LGIGATLAGVETGGDHWLGIAEGVAPFRKTRRDKTGYRG